jgi:stage II sporulation protein D
MDWPRFKTNLARISIIALLIALSWGCGRVPSLTDMTPPTSRLPFVKVLLDETATRQEISMAGGGEMAIDCYKKEKRASYYARRPVVILGAADKVELYDERGRRLDDHIDRMVISPRNKKHFLSFGGKKYRGLLELASISGQIRLVNIVYMEDYLKGVVPLEIGPTPKEQIEAIKAQAVAARTYSMAHLGQYGEESGYDLKSSIVDQLYGGVAAENDLVNEAVEATTGQVTVYQGNMISAYYHSTCGGATDDIEDIWDKQAMPYLRMVHDEDACRISKYFTWEERFTGEQLVLRLKQYLEQERGSEADISVITDIRIAGRTPGGRVSSITFETPEGHYVFDKEKVRWVVRRSDDPKAILRSANFTVDLKRNGRGQVTEVVFKGHGYGHGVGMCQMGARGMAEKGVAFDSILSLYYQGANLKKLY